MTKGNLLLHCGADHVTPEMVQALAPPEATKSYEPIGHWDMACLVKDVVESKAMGYKFHSWQFGLSHDGGRMFGVARFQDPKVLDLAFAVGMRNSYDKKFSAALAMGSQVFVCDNMCFSGEVMMMQRHQHDALLTMRRQLVGYLAEHSDSHFHEFLKMQGHMKACGLTDIEGYRFIGEALGKELLTATVANACLSEWRQAQYAEFAPRNLWSLYNAGTFALKRVPIDRQFQSQKGWDTFIRGVVLPQCVEVNGLVIEGGKIIDV